MTKAFSEEEIDAAYRKAAAHMWERWLWIKGDPQARLTPDSYRYYGVPYELTEHELTTRPSHSSMMNPEDTPMSATEKFLAAGIDAPLDGTTVECFGSRLLTLQYAIGCSENSETFKAFAQDQLAALMALHQQENAGCKPSRESFAGIAISGLKAYAAALGVTLPNPGKDGAAIA